MQPLLLRLVLQLVSHQWGDVESSASCQMFLMLGLRVFHPQTESFLRTVGRPRLNVDITLPPSTWTETIWIFVFLPVAKASVLRRTPVKSKSYRNNKVRMKKTSKQKRPRPPPIIRHLWNPPKSSQTCLDVEVDVTESTSASDALRARASFLVEASMSFATKSGTCCWCRFLRCCLRAS